MTYKDFTLTNIKNTFGITNDKTDLFPIIVQKEPNEWLKMSLELGFTQPLLSEKERSEALVYPVLKMLQVENKFRFQVYSGISLPADEDQGLKGECDFILGGRGGASELETPIFQVVEAKNGEITKHWGQVAAQMLGSRIFNEKNGNPHPTIYGCLTTGEEWQFLKLENTTIWIDKRRYALPIEIEKILGILQMIVDEQC